MYKNLFVICLVLAVATSNLFLTPANPPTAHQNQFYSTRFRVRGLDDPVFTFEGLPKNLNGNSNGVVSGIPLVPGAFSIVIKYRSGPTSGSREVILRVLEDFRSNDFIVRSTQTKIGLVIEYPTELIFRVGQPIRIPFSAKNAVGNLIWSFQNLPTGIKGSSLQGVIDGTIADSGYYNFNVQCADGEGKLAQAFITLNVQPRTSLTTSNVVDVPAIRRVQSSVINNYQKIEAEQVAADNELFKALEIVSTRRKIVADVKQHVATATLRVTNAQISFNAAEAEWRKATSDRDVAQALFISTQAALSAAQNNLQLALTEQGQSAKRVSDARKALEVAQQRFNAAQKAVTDAEAALVDAKAKFSKAEQALRTAQTQRNAAKQEYDRAFEALENAKTQLEDARARKIIADQAVKAARDALDIAQQARDDAENALKQADFNLNNAEKVLDAALKKVAAIRQKYNAAKNELSSAQWDWQLALNKLYVAQARKEAADRATSIALAEGSLSDHNVNNGVASIGGNTSMSNAAARFGGCDQKAYPSIAGNSRVTAVGSNGYTLASGHNVVYGPCSQASSNIAVGDFVRYNGYINNGVVNALRIERVLLS